MYALFSNLCILISIWEAGTYSLMQALQSVVLNLIRVHGGSVTQGSGSWERCLCDREREYTLHSHILVHARNCSFSLYITLMPVLQSRLPHLNSIHISYSRVWQFRMVCGIPSTLRDSWCMPVITGLPAMAA